jgi:hypothetical protein
MDKMKKKLFVLLVVIMLLTIVTVPAFATKPDDNVEGRWCYGNIVQEELKTSGGNIFYNLDDNGAWIGTFKGYSSDDGSTIVHSSGLTTFKSNVTFESVEVGGKTGGLEIRVNGWVLGEDISGYEGLWVITGATGDLSGLHGQGTWGGIELFNPSCSAIDDGMYFASVPYSGSIHFEND